MDGKSVIIREGNINDCEQLADSIQELADYLKAPDVPKPDADRLRKDGFGADKLFRCFVAEDGDILVGHAMYYFYYSAWEGANVFLEDLYVKPAYRQIGIGTTLWKEVAKAAISRGCNRLDLMCHGWDKQAVEFYKSKGSCDLTESAGWHLLRLSGKELVSFATD